MTIEVLQKLSAKASRTGFAKVTFLIMYISLSKDAVLMFQALWLCLLKTTSHRQVMPAWIIDHCIESRCGIKLHIIDFVQWFRRTASRTPVSFLSGLYHNIHAIPGRNIFVTSIRSNFAFSITRSGAEWVKDEISWSKTCWGFLGERVFTISRRKSIVALLIWHCDARV